MPPYMLFFVFNKIPFFFLEPHFPHTGNPSPPPPPPPPPPQVLCSFNTIDPDVPPKTKLELQQNYIFIKNSSFDGHPLFLHLNLHTIIKKGSCNFNGPPSSLHSSKQVQETHKKDPFSADPKQPPTIHPPIIKALQTTKITKLDILSLPHRF